MYTVIKNIIYIHQKTKETKTINVYCEMKPKLPKQRCHAIKLKCKATYFYTLACTQAHPWEDSGMQRSERASMSHCMYISYPVLIYIVISRTMLLLLFIFSTSYHFYDAHFPQTYNHIRIWNPLALLLAQPHKFLRTVQRRFGHRDSW